MKKFLPFIILGIIAFWVIGAYNGLVKIDEDTTNAWSKVESAYQERADLIPNLVATVKGYASHEKETLEAVVNARAKATSTTIDPSNLTAENMAQFQQAQSGLSGALSKLMVVVEKYPDLKANQNFLELQAALEGIEHRIRTERNRFNDAVTVYNKQVRAFPKNIIAGIFGFDKKDKFDAAEGSENAPKVEF